MYKSLLDAGVPIIIVDVLCNWYNKLHYAVDGIMHCQLSSQYSVVSGRAVVSHLLYSMFL